MDKNALEALVRQVLLEKLGGGAHGVRAVRVPDLPVSEEHRMDTATPATGSIPGICFPSRRARAWGRASWR